MTPDRDDCSTETATREWDILPPDERSEPRSDDEDTPMMDVTTEAEHYVKEHPFSPEPVPFAPGDDAACEDEPTSPPEDDELVGEDGEQDVTADGEEVADRFERPVAGAAA